MALELRLDGRVAFVTKDAKEMRIEVCAQAYGVAKARTAEEMRVIDDETGEVIYSYNCDDHTFTSSAWVQRFVEAFADRV